MKKIGLGLVIIFIVLLFLVFYYFQESEVEIDIAQEPLLEEEVFFNPDELKWNLAIENAPWEKRDAHSIELFNNKIFLMGGIEDGDIDIAYEYHKHFSDVWATENGKDWELMTDQAEFGQRRAHASVVFQNKIWIFGGWEKHAWQLKNDVWQSEDGKNWIEVNSSADWTPRKGHSAVVFKDKIYNKIYIIGGVDNYGAVNDVWASKDGLDWELITDSAPWVPRYDQTVTVFKDKLWLIGGVQPGLPAEKDIWVSEDGKNWELMTDSVSWKGRHGHCAIVFKDRIWILAGWSGTGTSYNDVWYSEDGLDWKKFSEESPFKGREDPDCLVFDDKIWIMGGMLTSGRRLNDVWFLGK